MDIDPALRGNLRSARRGADGCATDCARDGRRSGSVALEPLFGSRARDDVLAVAPAELGSQLALLAPERLQPLLQPLHLGFDVGVMSLGQAMPEVDPLLAEFLDLAVDCLQVSHIPLQRAHPRPIPADAKRNDGSLGNVSRLPKSASITLPCASRVHAAPTTAERN